MNRIGAGEYTLNDMAWCDGCAGAVPLSQIVAPPGRFAQPHKPPMNRPCALTQIASKKRTVSLLTVPWVFLGIMPMPSWLLSLETLGFTGIIDAETKCRPRRSRRRPLIRGLVFGVAASNGSRFWLCLRRLFCQSVVSRIFCQSRQRGLSDRHSEAPRQSSQSENRFPRQARLTVSPNFQLCVVTLSPRL